MRRLSLFACLVIALLSLLAVPGASAQTKVIQHTVTPIQQPSDMSCWAAAATMLVNWRNGGVLDQSIEEVVASAGPAFESIYQSSFSTPPQGISPSDEAAFYEAVGLLHIDQFNPTIDGWAGLLETNGPLSITVDANPGMGFIHALVMTGIDTDGTVGNTIVTYIDPADGQSHSVSFDHFISLYEGSANWPMQIIYNP